jgi:hypothetical protein
MRPLAVAFQGAMLSGPSLSADPGKRLRFVASADVAQLVEHRHRHLRESTILIEQKCVDGKIVPGEKTTRQPRSIPLLCALRLGITC